MNPAAYKAVSLVLLILFSAVALGDQRTPRTFLNSSQTEALKLPFSDAVMVGDTLYISGRGGLEPDTMRPPDDPAAEVRLLLDGYKALLAQADMSLSDLVFVTVYCPDLSLYATFNTVYKEYFDKDFPARAFIGSGPLLFGMRFEMQAIAVR